MAEPVQATAYVAAIVKELSSMFDRIPIPDAKHNIGRQLAQAYFWDTIVAFAKKRSDLVWDKLEKEEVITTEGLQPGEHNLADSPHFECKAIISQPVRRFDEQELSRLMKRSRYKVPEPFMREMTEKAKIPKKSSTTLKIVERLL